MLAVVMRPAWSRPSPGGGWLRLGDDADTGPGQPCQAAGEGPAASAAAAIGRAGATQPTTPINLTTPKHGFQWR